MEDPLMASRAAEQSRRPSDVASADPSLVPRRAQERHRVPIRSLGSRHRGLILAHLSALGDHDRYLRFGYAATDSQLARYVEGLDFKRDKVYGIIDRRLRLIAVAHLAYAGSEAGRMAAEFGVSVLERVRGRGYGARLFQRAATHARNDGIKEMYIHALSENKPMLEIARRAGAIVVRYGSESEAHLQLPPADLDSRVSEVLQEQWALADHQLKQGAWQFQRVLGTMGLDHM